MEESIKEPITLTTYVNGKKQEWITIIENGIPVWTYRENLQKANLHDELKRLFKEAVDDDDDEPVIRIRTSSGKNYDASFFPAASLYLCEDLEGRYATLSTFIDAIWPLLFEDPVTSCQRL